MSELLQNMPLPFRDSVVDSEHPRKMTLSARPSILIRADGVTNTTEGLQEVSSLLKELEDEYGIKNPGYNPVMVGHDSETARPLTLTKRIVGVSLIEAAGTKDPDVIDKITNLYNGLARYLEDKFKSKKTFLGDIYGEHQYMYGHVEGETGDSIYLTDVAGETADPEKYTQALPEFFSEKVVRCAIYMYQDMTNMTEITGHDFPALDRIIKLMNTITVQNKTLNEIVNLINNAKKMGQSAPKKEIEELMEKV